MIRQVEKLMMEFDERYKILFYFKDNMFQQFHLPLSNEYYIVLHILAKGSLKQ